MKVILIGATGLTGSYLLKRLIEDQRIEGILIFGRRPVGVQHQKIKEHIIDYDKPETWKHLVQGDVLFSCLGTTLSKAGRKKKQYIVDFQYQYDFAEIALRNEVKHYILVSAAGANSRSPFFYMRMKGQLEDAVKRLQFSKIHIMHPNILDGNRKEKRSLEKLGLNVIKFFNRIGLFKRMKPTHADDLAAEMIQHAMQR